MTVIKCDRCRRRYRNSGEWNVTLSRGVPVGYLCPRCQTPEENAEAEVNLATTVYGVDQFGRVVGKAKV